MRITTWNVNSVRLRGGIIRQLIDEMDPDVLCLQEIKVETAKFPHEIFDGTKLLHRHIHGQKGYHGVAILSKVPLADPQTRFACGNEEHRHAFVSLPGNIVLHNLYIPAGGDIPDPGSNPKFRQKLEMIEELTILFRSSHNGRKILVGDFNIAPLPSDVWSHKQLLKVVSHTPVEVEKLDAWRSAGEFTDAVRMIFPQEEKLFSWWSYRSRDWSASDRGRRLDHIWVGSELVPTVTTAHVFREARGWDQPSDHVPVTIDLAL